MSCVKIRFLPWDRVLETEGGETLLELAIEHDIPLPHACGGDAVCSTCAVEIQEGWDCLATMEEVEREALDKFLPGCSARTRLSCQTAVVLDSDGTVLARSLESAEG